MTSVLVGMSGGVDSSVAAYLLKERGYDVVGVSFILCEGPLRSAPEEGVCGSPDSLDDARQAARQIGIDHAVLDLTRLFLECVIEPFIEGYRRGITPNPCILCNSQIKFPALMRAADEGGIDRVSTGHYARAMHGGLFKGLDARKDQSYVLYGLGADILKRLMLPLGDMAKTAVRATAESLGLRAARRPESQEICFVGSRRCWDFLEKATGRREGPIVDIVTGKVIGRHRGVHLYTIGQRKRLVPIGKPRYVVRIDAPEDTVYVGPREMACTRDFRVKDVIWSNAHRLPPHNGVPASLRARVKVRSTMQDEPAFLTVLNGEVHVRFDEPQWAPAPGQSAVFYRDDAVLGGGVIASDRTSKT